MKLIFQILIAFLLISCTKKISNNDKIEETSFITYIGETAISRGVTVEQTIDGGYILTGYTTDGEYGGEDVFLIKTNSKGAITWRKIFGGEGKDNGWAVRQNNDRGYIIVGFTNSFRNGNMDVYSIRTDSIGEIIWTKTYGGEGDEFGWDIRITEDDGFIIAAQTNSHGEGEIDAYLIKIDEGGNEEWAKTYGGNKIDRIFSTGQTQDGGYIAAGITYSYTSVDSGDRDGYLLKTDSSGEQEWYKTLGKDLYDVAHSVAITDDSGYLITGYGESFAASGNRDIYLVKTDGNGENQWIKAYGGIGEERGIKGIQTKDGGYAAIGFTDRNKDMYFIRTNNLGDTLWTRTYGTVDHLDFGYTVKETNDGGYILIGHSERLDSEKSSIMLIKTNSEGLVNPNDQ